MYIEVNIYLYLIIIYIYIIVTYYIELVYELWLLLCQIVIEENLCASAFSDIAKKSTSAYHIFAFIDFVY